MRNYYAVAMVVGLLMGCGSPSPTQSTSPTQPTTLPSPQPPRVVVKRVPCKVRLGPLSASIEIDLSELRNLVLDAKQLYNEVVNGEPSNTPPERGTPVVMVVNKRANKFTYFQLTPNVKELRLKAPEAGEVELIVKNQEPLQVELWVSTDKPIDVDIEFKDGLPVEKK